MPASEGKASGAYLVIDRVEHGGTLEVFGGGQILVDIVDATSDMSESFVEQFASLLLEVLELISSSFGFFARLVRFFLGIL